MQLEQQATEQIEAGAEVKEVANLGALLDLEQSTEVPATSEDDQGETGAEASKSVKPTKFNDLAEATGLELDELYNLEVTIADGETITVEQLKALKGDADDLTVRQLEVEEEHARGQAELRKAQNEIAEIVAGLPEGTVNAKTLETVRARQAARIEVEQQRTLDAIPTWQDAEARAKDMQGMASHLERFGFPVDHLGAIHDHRMILFIRDSYQREQRIQKALAKVRAGAPNPTTSTKANPKAGKGKTSNPVQKNGDARNRLESFFSDVE